MSNSFANRGKEFYLSGLRLRLAAIFIMGFALLYTMFKDAEGLRPAYLAVARMARPSLNIARDCTPNIKTVHRNSGLTEAPALIRKPSNTSIGSTVKTYAS